MSSLKWIFTLSITTHALLLMSQKNFESVHLKTQVILNELVQRNDIVGASVAVGQGDSILYAKGLGLADKDLEIKVQPYHKFRIYSLSKHITAIAAAKLVESRYLALDSAISLYIPLLNPPLSKVTSRQLIGHQAGVRSYFEGEWQKFSNSACSSPFEAILAFESDTLLFLSGEEFRYTSYGYVLLSAVIEKVSGQPFMDYLNNALFKPIGIENVTLDNADINDHLSVKSYEFWQKTMYNARYANNTCKFGGGGLAASPTSVVLFNLNLLNEMILSEQTIHMLFSSMKLNNGEDTQYGFGLEFDRDEKGRFYAWHSGRSRGGRNALVIYPEQKLVVCLSANTNGESIVDLAETIAKNYLEEL